jgi:uroporphyrinogen III methyltransferase/synthase
VAQAGEPGRISSTRPGSRGHVWLVGAGPGDPGLLTVRGREVLAEADVVVTDRLAAAVLLDWARPDAEVIHVGKSPTTRSRTQEEVNTVLVRRALGGATVVRLKGGDPFLFGRGGEEAEACAAAGVPCTVVPGVTSALAAPAYAGIPVTHRGLAQDLVIVSGHLPPGHPESTVDWAALGGSAATVVVLMGVARLVAIAEALLAGGRPPTTPAAVIERATTPAQRVLRTTLASLSTDAIAAGVRSPAVIVVGAVAAGAVATAAGGPGHGDPAAGGRAARAHGPDAGRPEVGRPDVRGRQVGDRAVGRSAAGGGSVGGGSPADGGPAGTGASPPLAGVRVLVPRTRTRPGLLAHRLSELGADAVETVVSRLSPVDDASGLLDALPGADALVLADADEVAAAVMLLRRSGTDVRALAGVTLVATSDDAAAALDAVGLVSVRSTTEVRVAHTVVTDVPVSGLRVVVCASAPPPVGIRTVRRITLLVDTLPEPDRRLAEDIRHGDFDVVAFASSTAARATAELYGPLPADLLVAAMGRRTVQACRSAGLEVAAVAPEPGIHGLAAAITDLIAATRRSGSR